MLSLFNEVHTIFTSFFAFLSCLTINAWRKAFYDAPFVSFTDKLLQLTLQVSWRTFYSVLHCEFGTNCVTILSLLSHKEDICPRRCATITHLIPDDDSIVIYVHIPHMTSCRRYVKKEHGREGHLWFYGRMQFSSSSLSLSLSLVTQKTSSSVR